MFTGLIQSKGVVRSIEAVPGGQPGSVRVEVETQGWDHRPSLGDSIAVNGCCLTVALEPTGTVLAFDAIAETLDKTTLGSLVAGTAVNLEHAVTGSTLMGGHVVQGHVDGVGTVIGVEQSDGWRTRIEPPTELMRYIVPKGSVTVEGVSLTIAAVDVDAGWFEVALIPVTLRDTTLGETLTGTRVNLESDVTARTVVHYLENFLEGAGKQ